MAVGCLFKDSPGAGLSSVPLRHGSLNQMLRADFPFDLPGWNIPILTNSAKIANNSLEVNSIDFFSLVPNSCVGY